MDRFVSSVPRALDFSFNKNRIWEEKRISFSTFYILRKIPGKIIPQSDISHPDGSALFLLNPLVFLNVYRASCCWVVGGHAGRDFCLACSLFHGSPPQAFLGQCSPLIIYFPVSSPKAPKSWLFPIEVTYLLYCPYPFSSHLHPRLWFFSLQTFHLSFSLQLIKVLSSVTDWAEGESADDR